MTAKTKLTKLEMEELAVGFRYEIAHRYSYKVTHWASSIIRAAIKICFVRNIYINKIDNISDIPKDIPVILSVIHKSHLDYMILNMILHFSKHILPATISGKNLYHGIFRNLLPAAKSVCLDRERVDPKNLRNRENLIYLSTFYSYLVDGVIKKGDAITIFPEGGRSYSGEVKPLSLGIFGIAKRALQEYDKVAIIPVSISFDRVTEDTRFSKFPALKKISSKAYRKHDKWGFYKQALLQPDSDAYLDFGDPIYVDDVRNMAQLELDVRSKMGALVRVTAVALVAISTNGKEYITLAELLENMSANLKIAKERNLLLGTKIGISTPEKILKRSFKHIKNPLRFRSIITIKKENGEKIVHVKDLEAIKYYTNTISHLFND